MAPIDEPQRSGSSEAGGGEGAEGAGEKEGEGEAGGGKEEDGGQEEGPVEDGGDEEESGGGVLVASVVLPTEEEFDCTSDLFVSVFLEAIGKVDEEMLNELKEHEVSCRGATDGAAFKFVFC